MVEKNTIKLTHSNRPAEGDVNMQNFLGCRVAVVVRWLGGLEQEDKALQYPFCYWLPRSRCQPANLPGTEIYRLQPVELEWGHTTWVVP